VGAGVLVAAVAEAPDPVVFEVVAAALGALVAPLGVLVVLLVFAAAELVPEP
jgi:hypothetical protein